MTVTFVIYAMHRLYNLCIFRVMFQCDKKLNDRLQYKEVKDVMDKMKDVILISNLTKATEAVANLSSQAIFGGLSSPAAVVKKDAKRKKGRKSSEAK